MSDTVMTVNQNIRPLNTRRNNKGNLEISGCDTVELAEKYGTPLYVMDEVTLRTIAREYKNAFKNYKKVNMMYASKALMTAQIAKFCTVKVLALMLYQAGKFTL